MEDAWVARYCCISSRFAQNGKFGPIQEGSSRGVEAKCSRPASDSPVPSPVSTAPVSNPVSNKEGHTIGSIERGRVISLRRSSSPGISLRNDGSYHISRASFLKEIPGEELLRKDIARPLSVDPIVWPSIFDTGFDT